MGCSRDGAVGFAASAGCDPAERTPLIERYLPLVRRTAGRFTGRGERFEDLVQVGAIGLIRAIDRRDPQRPAELTSYVAQCVEGEIRRHLRDRCTLVRIPRHLQAERPPAAQTPLPLEEGLEYARTAPEPPLEEVGEARALVAVAARLLEPSERRIVALRYFCDLSQAEIGRLVGTSQVQVSRHLQRAITKMRAELVTGTLPGS